MGPSRTSASKHGIPNTVREPMQALGFLHQGSSECIHCSKLISDPVCFIIVGCYAARPAHCHLLLTLCLRLCIEKLHAQAATASIITAFVACSYGAGADDCKHKLSLPSWSTAVLYNLLTLFHTAKGCIHLLACCCSMLGCVQI